jgi:hypothetical protein
VGSGEAAVGLASQLKSLGRNSSSRRRLLLPVPGAPDPSRRPAQASQVMAATRTAGTATLGAGNAGRLHDPFGEGPRSALHGDMSHRERIDLRDIGVNLPEAVHAPLGTVI